MPVTVEINGSVGYYCAGMNKLATVLVHGSAGVGVAENMMSGFVHVSGDASQAAGATGRGGLLRIDGNASSRCGISMKGIDIVVQGSVGHMSAFMAQSGNLVVFGDAGDSLGDSIYEARLFVRGSVKSLGADCIEKEMRDEHKAAVHDVLTSCGASTARSILANSSDTGRPARSTLSTSITQMRVLMDATPRTTPRKSATFDDYSLSEIRRAAASGIYDIRGRWGAKRKVPHFDDLLFLGASISRYPLEGYREKCATDVWLGTRYAQKPIHLKIPITIAGMSFGSLSAQAKEALGRGASKMGTSTTTGDGGMTEEERGHSSILVYQLLPSRYGMNPDDLRRADAIEIVIGQGAKPGGGGMLLGQKISDRVAEMRTLPKGIDQRSACRHPDWTGPDDLEIKIQELRENHRLAEAHLHQGRRLAALLRRRSCHQVRRRRGGARRHAGRHGRDPRSFHRACRPADPGRHSPGGAGAARPRHAPQGPADRLRRHPQWRRCGQGARTWRGRRFDRGTAALVALGDNDPALEEHYQKLGTTAGAYDDWHEGQDPSGINTQNPELSARLDPQLGGRRLANYLAVMTLEAQTITRAPAARATSIIWSPRISLRLRSRPRLWRKYRWPAPTGFQDRKHTSKARRKHA